MSDEVDFMPQPYQYIHGQMIEQHTILPDAKHTAIKSINDYENLGQCNVSMNGNQKYATISRNNNYNSGGKRISQASSNASMQTGPEEKASIFPDDNLYPLQTTNSIYNNEHSIANESIYYKSNTSEQSPVPYQIVTSVPKVYYSTTNGHPHHNGDSVAYINGDNENMNGYEIKPTPAVSPSLQQLPPPYHIAKAFTKKSKQDLLTYDIYRNNYQQVQSPQTGSFEKNGQPTTDPLLMTPTDLDKNLNGNDFDENQEDEHVEPNEPNHNVDRDNLSHSAMSTSSSTSWLFGLHKNPTVVSTFLI